MTLSDLSVKRPVFASVLSFLLVAFGVLAFQNLPLRELPDIDPPVVSIEVFYRGASASIVETRITQILEDAISGIEGVETISSTSRDARSDVVIQFSLDRDIEAAANDVRSAVSRVVDQLPPETDLPEITKIDSDGNSLMWWSLTSNEMSPIELADYAERNIVDRLSVLNGVARVRFGAGGLREAMRIWPDRKRMAARGLTIRDVEDALRRENIESPAGKIESDQRDFTIRLERTYSKAEDFAALPLKQGDDGHIVRLGEIAIVEKGLEDHRYFFRGNGVPRVGVGIVKQSRANTLEVVQTVREEMARIIPTLPEGAKLTESYDASLYINEAIKEVYVTLSISMGLVIFVIYAFLGSLRTAIIPAVTVPVALIATFSALLALGLSINLLTLLALILSIGLVVDDSIVVLENIQRRVDEGETPLVAAYHGTRQVAFAVIATTTVLVAVFVPIVFITGDVGRLFSELAVAVGAAVVFSTIVALSLSPMLCSKILVSKRAKTGWVSLVDRFFDRLRTVYIRLLSQAIDRPLLTSAVIIGIIGVTFFIYRAIPSELAPPEDRGGFFAFMSGPPGASFDYSVDQMRMVEEIIRPYTETGEIHLALARVPASFGLSADYSGGFLIINLSHWNERERNGQEIVAELNRKFAELPGVRLFGVMGSGLVRSRSSRPVEFVIGGPNYDELARWRDIVLDRARENPGLVGVNADYEEKTPQFKVEIDRVRASDLGVSVDAIGNTLATMLGSKRVTTYQDRGEEYDVILQVQPDDRREPNDLTNIYVRSERSGALIPLANLVTLKDEAAAASLNRFNRLRSITISAALVPGYNLGDALDFLEGVVKDELPETAVIDYKGESRSFKIAGGAVMFTFALALMVVFLVLAAQFESYIHPLTIMLTVPLAIAGALLGLFLTGGSLNLYSQVGIVILIGIAAKNGILIVEFANQLRDEGQEFRSALMKAAEVRLRPIVMTGMSTALGAMPLVLASGAGSASRSTIGIVIFSGVFFATLTTLFVVPVFYNLIGRYTRSPGTIARLLAVQETQSAKAAAPAE